MAPVNFFCLRSLSPAPRSLALVLTAAASIATVRAVSLSEYAEHHPLVVQRIVSGEEVSLGKENQTNNLKKGANILVLSSLGLTSLEGISRLTVLDAGKPTPLAEVADLQLFLNNNQIETVPDEFASLGKVTFIYFNVNRIRTIPRAVTKMKSLEGMYFTSNALTEIPAHVFAMKRLRKFQISRNRVQEVPEAFGNLTNLIHLNLAENEIAHLPESMAQLTQLRVCDLSGNRLTELPEAFGRVQILYQLRVRDNPLTTLPAGFAAMPGTIDITGTKIDRSTLPGAIQAKISTEKPAVKPSVIVKRPSN
jgi:Leucine-rich repeat (LRR) protein